MPPRKSKPKPKTARKPRQKRPAKSSQKAKSKPKDPLKPSQTGVTKRKNNPARQKRAKKTTLNDTTPAEVRLADALGELSLKPKEIQSRGKSAKGKSPNNNALKKLNDAIQQDVGLVNGVISGFVDTKRENAAEADTVEPELQPEQPNVIQQELGPIKLNDDRSIKKRSATPKQQHTRKAMIALNAQIQADAAVAQRDVAEAIMIYASR